MRTKSLSILFILFLLANCLLGQSDSTNIQNQEFHYKSKMPGKGYYYQGQPVLPKEIPELVKNSSEAYNLAKSANSSGGLAQVLGFVGGFMIGLPLGTMLAGGEPQWGLVGVGAAFIAIGIPMTASANKKMQQAIRIYNESLQEKPITGLKLEVAGGPFGFGLKLRF